MSDVINKLKEIRSGKGRHIMRMIFNFNTLVSTLAREGGESMVKSTRKTCVCGYDKARSL